MKNKYLNFLQFFNNIEKLKSVTRHSWTSSGRQESVPDHSWRMAVMALAFADEFPEIDINKVIKLVLIHDLGEAIDGDVPAFLGQPDHKLDIEEKTILKLTTPLNPQLRAQILALWREYEDYQTLESKLAKALDKLEVVIQHNEADLSTWIEEEYSFNLTYGQKYMDFHKFIKEFRKLVDQQTKEKIAKRR